MIVVGGSYQEVCRDPQRDDFVGSGQRAAIALRSVVKGDLRLVTAVDEESRMEAETLAEGGGIDLEVVDRSEPIKFVYATPLSAPIISGARATAPEPIRRDADNVLAFGMLETKQELRAKRLVFDPQQPQDLSPLALEQLRADQLAIVANAVETQMLAGGVRSLEEAALKLRATANAEVLVTKAGARGALVTTSNNQEWVGPNPTSSVWPIGSGDVFAAGFAWAWGCEEADPMEAAKAGSMAAAHWCGTERLNLPADAFTTSPSHELKVADGRVYLAGPFFNVSERWLVDLVNESLRSLGGLVFSPLHDVGRGHDIADEDLAGLEDCTAVLALLDHNDPGTIFEIGWARKRGIPVVGLAENLDEEGAKMLLGSGVVILKDLSSAVYRALWASMGGAAVG